MLKLIGIFSVSWFL